MFSNCCAIKIRIKKLTCVFQLDGQGVESRSSCRPRTIKRKIELESTALIGAVVQLRVWQPDDQLTRSEELFSAGLTSITKLMFLCITSVWKFNFHIYWEKCYSFLLYRNKNAQFVRFGYFFVLVNEFDLLTTVLSYRVLLITQLT